MSNALLPTDRFPKRPSENPTLESPLPPLAKQRRVVARIEALAAKITEARRLRAEAVEEAEVMVGTAAVKLLDAYGKTISHFIEDI